MSRFGKLKEMYAAATLGEWKPCRDGEDFDGPYFEIEDEDRVEFEARPFTSIRSSSGTVAAAHDLFTFKSADAEFIALAHNLMPQLFEAVELLKVAAHALETPGDFSPEELETQVVGDIGEFLATFEQQGD